MLRLKTVEHHLRVANTSCPQLHRCDFSEGTQAAALRRDLKQLSGIYSPNRSVKTTASIATEITEIHRPRPQESYCRVEMNVENVEVNSAPVNFDKEYETILTADAVEFVSKLVVRFDPEVQEVLQLRQLRKLELQRTNDLPDFKPNTAHLRQSAWQVKPVPPRLKCRHVDLGDTSPSNTSHFVEALKSSAQGIQTDFDDGHCPTWRNQLLGMYNVFRAVHNQIEGVGHIGSVPVLMLRPRAWNMVEHNILVNGKEISGPLFDFGLLMFHNAKILLDNNSGPYFYLSKLEGSKEARLWNRIFDWTESELQLPSGCTKACVLIENVLASFEMHEILYELRDHTAGLNCGIWDYSASFINKFGSRHEFLLPDRNKYVSMERHFLHSYMDLVVQTCHRRGCHATGGMAALLLPWKSASDDEYQRVLKKVMSAKRKEIEAGVDGFMVYDIRLVKPMQQLFKELTSGDNQMTELRGEVAIAAADLLLMPTGGVNLAGLRHNIIVGVMFIEAWLRGQGHFYLKGAVEDSATAEISRSQVWQWIRHRAILEDSGKMVTMTMVQKLVNEVATERFWGQEDSQQFVTSADRLRLYTAARMFEEIVTMRDFPEFITTYLNLDHTFLTYHS